MFFPQPDFSIFSNYFYIKWAIDFWKAAFNSHDIQKKIDSNKIISNFNNG